MSKLQPGHRFRRTCRIKRVNQAASRLPLPSAAPPDGADCGSRSVLMSGEQRKTWTSRIGFVLASAGAAVGLGPSGSSPHGGHERRQRLSLPLYILMTFTVGAALLIAEVALGRAARGGIGRPTATSRAAPGCPQAISAFSRASCPSASIRPSEGGRSPTSPKRPRARASSPTRPSSASTSAACLRSRPGTRLPVALPAAQRLIVALDVTKGIERISKFLMPLLFVMMLVLIVRGLMLPGAIGGLEFLKFDPDAFT